MKTKRLMYLSQMIGAAILATSMSAQAQQTDFPSQGTDSASCAEVDWNEKMMTEHPRLIEGCREVVSAGGLNWARFEALFDRVKNDGTVSFKIRDERKRIVETVAFQPTAGQVAYISDRPVEFRRLANDQMVNLYVPEGKYGFATSTDVPVTQLATVVHAEPAPELIAAAEPPRQQTLPKTASVLPWFALTGGLMMFGSLGLLIFRREG